VAPGDVKYFGPPPEVGSPFVCGSHALTPSAAFIIWMVCSFAFVVYLLTAVWFFFI
jgi:hypothetical protein